MLRVEVNMRLKLEMSDNGYLFFIMDSKIFGLFLRGAKDISVS